MSDQQELERFARLYFEKGMPNNACLSGADQVVETDDAVSYVVYRKGRIQVEMYLMLAGRVVAQGHAHPNVRTMLFELIDNKWVNKGTVYDMEPHGDGDRITQELEGIRRYDTTQLLAIEMWDEGVEITSVAKRWVGATAGPKHNALIESEYPNSVVGGYADIRKSEKFKSEK